MELRLAGRFNAHNALAVVALGQALDLPADAVRAGLAASLHLVFVAGLPLMGLALILALLLKEVPLRSVSYVSAPSEAAMEAGRAAPGGAGALSVSAAQDRSSS